MISIDVLGKLAALPKDTPVTVEHLLMILNASHHPQIKSDEEYSKWDKEKLIDEVVVAKWLIKNVQTLRNWRCDGKGPKFIKDSRSISYKVGTVREWIKSREVQSTTQADKLQ